MKKVFTLVTVAGMLALVACGPSAEQKAAEEKRVADSMASAQAAEVEKAKADSVAAAEMAAIEKV